MMKKILKYLSVVAIVGLVAYAGIQPNVGLTWTSATDPTTGGGVSAPMWQFLIRTDAPGIYYKSGASNTAWTAIGGASAGATVVTDGTSITGTGSTGSKIALVPLTSDVTTTSANVATISNNVVTNAKLAQAPALTVKANGTNGTANETDIAAGTAGGTLGRSGNNTLAFSVEDQGFFGTGFDGTCNFDGVTTPVAGATLSGSVYTMTRDIMCENATVSNAIDVKLQNFRFMVHSTLTMTGTARLHANGGNGGSPTAGTLGAPAGYCAAPTAAGAGGTGSAVGATGGAAGGTSAMQPYYSDATGTGALAGSNGQYTGAGAGGGTAVANGGGLGGSFNKLIAGRGAADLITIWDCQTNNGGTQQFIQAGGGGGGAAAGGTTGTGGGGGGAGGFDIIAARIIAGNGTCAFQSNGGNGGNGTLGNGTAAGGGGGGGGGTIDLMYLTATGGTVGGCTQSVTGGTGGTGAGTGASGGNGHNGLVVRYNFSGDGT